MYLLTVLAFAFVLWLPEDLPIQPVVRKPWLILALIGFQQAAMVGLGRLVSHLTIRRLNSGAEDPQGAQHICARGGLILRWVLVVSFIGLCIGTDCVEAIRRIRVVETLFGATDLITLLPFLFGAVMLWVGLFPGDLAIRQVSLANRAGHGGAIRSLWTLWGYLLFHVRNQLLIVALPMTAILIAYDAIHQYGPWLVRSTGMSWLREGLLGASAGLVFLLAPAALRHIWSTKPLPDGPLRRTLQETSRRMGLTYREILIWQSEGNLVNAAVMGIFSPLRYVILSDGLLESMTEDEIKAVFGHEAGHVKLRHMEFFILFAMASMFLVGGVVEGVRYVARPEGWMIDTLGFALIVLLWGAGFGWISRRFERQADLFGARCLAGDISECTEECVVHGGGGSAPAGRSDSAVCVSAARTFARGLYRVARLNGIPAKEPSWRHSSIESRAEFLLSLSAKPSRAEAFDRLVGRIKAGLLAGTAVGLAGSIWFYWPLWR